MSVFVSSRRRLPTRVSRRADAPEPLSRNMKPTAPTRTATTAKLTTVTITVVDNMAVPVSPNRSASLALRVRTTHQPEAPARPDVFGSSIPQQDTFLEEVGGQLDAGRFQAADKTG